MELNRNLFDEVGRNVSGYAVSYFKSVFNIDFNTSLNKYFAGNSVHLRDMTAMVLLGGAFNIVVGFSFEDYAIRQVTSLATLGLSVTQDEWGAMMRATAADVVNEIVGLSTAALSDFESLVAMSSPSVFGGIGSLQLPQQSVAICTTLAAESICLDLWLFWPGNVLLKKLSAL